MARIVIWHHDFELLTYFEDALPTDGAVVGPVGLNEVALGAVSHLLRWTDEIIITCLNSLLNDMIRDILIGQGVCSCFPVALSAWRRGGPSRREGALASTSGCPTSRSAPCPLLVDNIWREQILRKTEQGRER